MSRKLTWLHISDIHFQPKTAWQNNGVRDELLDYLKNQFERDASLRPDLVFCTGDIAFGESTASKLTEQYELASKFFDNLLAVCGKKEVPLAKERLFVVPGNHDVNRKNIPELSQSALIQRAAESKVWHPKINQLFEDMSQELKGILRRLDEYAQFVKDYLPHQHDEKGRHCYAQTVEVNGLKVGIAGFNSAWSCSGPEDDRKIWLPAAWQFANALELIKESQIRIGLIHHPVDWFNKQDHQIARNLISANFHFWLHGHSHNTWVTPINSHVIISAGAVEAQHSNEFGINLVQLNLAESRGTIYLHEHNTDESGWKPATVATHAENGQWSIDTLPGSLRSLAKPSGKLEYREHSHNFS